MVQSYVRSEMIYASKVARFGPKLAVSFREVQYRRTWVFVNSQTSTLALCLRNDTDVTGYRIPRIPRPTGNEAL